MSLDGWDAWGLLLALLVVATVAIVALGNLTDVEFSDDVPWPTITLGLGIGHPRRRRREEPHGRRLVVDQLRLRRARCRRLGRHVPRLGGDAQVPRAPSSSASAAGSAQSFDEEDAVLPGTVVVRDDALDLESQRLVEGDGPLIHG